MPLLTGLLSLPDVLIDTLQALTENPHLACLSDLAKSASQRGSFARHSLRCRCWEAVLLQDWVSFSNHNHHHVFPGRVREDSPSCRGGCLPGANVAAARSCDIPKVFKEAYTDMMVNGGGRWAKLGSQIEQDNHSCWVIFKGCNLEVVDPSPLNTVLMDKDIKEAMSFLTDGVPPGRWAADASLRKIAYKDGSIPAGAFAEE